MPSLIDIRRRIRSVKNTQQITKAMKMVSAAKLRRAQDRVIAARPYASALRKVIDNVAAAGEGHDRAFNTNLVKAAVRFPAEHGGAEMTLELIGRKGRDFFRKRSAQISGD